MPQAQELFPSSTGSKYGTLTSYQNADNRLPRQHYSNVDHISYTAVPIYWCGLIYRIARNFCRDFNLVNCRIFFTKSPKSIPPNMRAHMRIMVRNGVVCGAHVFAKLKFTNNIFRSIRQL